VTSWVNMRDSIDRSRELAADVRAGRVRSDGEHAGPLIERLVEYLDDVAAVADAQYLAEPAPESEQAALRAALLAEVPASVRAEGNPDNDTAHAVATQLAALPGAACTVVTRWLRAARQEGGQR